MHDFRFMTRFTVTADRSASFQAALDVQRWARSWPEAVHTQVLQVGRADGLGRRGRASLRAPLDIYRLEFEVEVTEIDAPRWFTVETRGDLRGTGRWTFAPVDDETATSIVFDWRLQLRHPLLAAAGGLLRPALVAAHHRAARHGVRAYAGALGAEVLECRSRLVGRD